MRWQVAAETVFAICGEDVEEFKALTAGYDALIVRINPGQLSQGTSEGTQARFDALMNRYISEGKLVWSSPKIQTQMGAKDALVNIGKLNCGLEDTYAYYSEEDLVAGFKTTCAFQPRVIKQNRGSAGEGIWLCWLEGKDYCAPSGAALLEDDDKVKLMEMNAARRRAASSSTSACCRASTRARCAS